MEALGHLADGFGAVLQPEALLWTFVGVFLGTVVGVLPGLGSSATIAIMLPLTIAIGNPTYGLMMAAGVYYGSEYGGSTTSILMKMPGENSSVMTTLDGYELSKLGRAGAALGIAAISSFIAGTVGVLGLTFLAIPLARLALNFGPPEFFGLMALALVTVVFLSGRSMVKGIIAALFGLLFATFGTDLFSGAPRFYFGIPALLDGIALVTLSVGLFAIGEIFTNVGSETRTAIFKVPRGFRKLFPTKQDLKDSRGAWVRGSVIGFAAGVMPGLGTNASSVFAYVAERQVSKHPEKFGTGVIEGVAAPEGANNATTSGSLVPMLSLGIPGSTATAILLSILVAYGVAPGPRLFTDHPEIVWPFIASMYIGNVMLLVLNLPLVPLFASLLRLPYYTLYTGILLLAVVGAYNVAGSVFEVWLILGFGLLGFGMRRLEIPIAPMLLAFVLEKYVERAFRQSMVISDNSLAVFIEHPISMIALGIAATLLLIPLVRTVTRYVSATR